MMRVLVAIGVGLLPLPALAASQLNCVFGQTCLAKTCQTWPDAKLSVSFLDTGDGAALALWVGDNRMLSGPTVTAANAEGRLSLFPGFAFRPDTFVYGVGEWTNADEEPRMSISVTLNNQTLTLKPTSEGGATLTSDSNRIDAAFGFRRFVGDCEAGAE